MSGRYSRASSTSSSDSTAVKIRRKNTGSTASAPAGSVSKKRTHTATMGHTPATTSIEGSVIASVSDAGAEGVSPVARACIADKKVSRRSSRLREKELLNALEDRLTILTSSLNEALVSEKGIEMIKEIKELYGMLEGMRSGSGHKDTQTSPRIVVVWDEGGGATTKDRVGR